MDGFEHRFTHKWGDTQWRSAGSTSNPGDAYAVESAGEIRCDVKAFFTDASEMPVSHVMNLRRKDGTVLEIDHFEVDGQRFVRAPKRDWDVMED